MILNLFCYEYKEFKLGDTKDKYQNSKLIPNYIASFDFIKKIIFDENFHSKIIADNKCLSQLGTKTDMFSSVLQINSWVSFRNP